MIWLCDYIKTDQKTKSEETPGKVPKKPLHVIEYLLQTINFLAWKRLVELIL